MLSDHLKCLYDDISKSEEEVLRYETMSLKACNPPSQARQRPADFLGSI